MNVKKMLYLKGRHGSVTAIQIDSRDAEHDLQNGCNCTEGSQQEADTMAGGLLHFEPER
jgi:hypothetical protein